jgi:hypothetical protein
MEIFKFLEKSNCRECGEKTCLAFAGAVYQGRKQLKRCPRLDEKILERYTSASPEKDEIADQMGENFVDELKPSLLQLDFREAAFRSGSLYDGEAITLKILGRNFSITPDGDFKTDIHANAFITAPILDYLLNTTGAEPSGEWISFRELKESDDFMHGFFKKRCETVLKKIADTHTDLFDDLVDIFGGKRVEAQFQADISVVLYPFPKVPIMICYLKPEDGMPSTLNVFFDQSVNVNLSIDSVLTICNGFAYMIEKITEKHGVIAV